MAEPLPSAFSWLDSVKQGIVRQIATALSAPETVGPNLWSAVKDLAGNLGVTQGEDWEKMSLKEKLQQIGGGFGPGNVGMAGTIRVGGRPDLMMHHGASNFGLARTDARGNVNLVPEISHPSIEITKGPELQNDFQTGAILIPRIGAFDPAYSRSTLFNRDAYLARAGDFPWRSKEVDPEKANAIERNLTRFGDKSVRTQPPVNSESTGTNWMNPDWTPGPVVGTHRIAMQASPAFRSFAEYEQSQKGAGPLLQASEGGVPVAEWAAGFLKDYSNWAVKEGGLATVDWLAALRQAAGKGDKEAQRLMRSAQTAPSEYAELKVPGPVPLTGDRWAGVLLPPGNEAIKQAFMDRGIFPEDMQGSKALQWQIAHDLQQRAGPVPEQPLSGKAYVPPVKRQFFVTRGAKEAEPPQMKETEFHEDFGDAQNWVNPVGEPTGTFWDGPAAPKPTQEPTPMFNIQKSPHLVNTDLLSKAKQVHSVAPNETLQFKWGMNKYLVNPTGDVMHIGFE